MALLWYLGLFSDKHSMQASLKISALLVTKQELRSPEHPTLIVGHENVAQ